MELNSLELKILKGIIIILGCVFGCVLASFSMVLKDPSIAWMLLITVPTGAIVLFLLRGALGVMAKSNLEDRKGSK